MLQMQHKSKLQLLLSLTLLIAPLHFASAKSSAKKTVIQKAKTKVKTKVKAQEIPAWLKNFDPMIPLPFISSRKKRSLKSAQNVTSKRKATSKPIFSTKKKNVKGSSDAPKL